MILTPIPINALG